MANSSKDFLASIDDPATRKLVAAQIKEQDGRSFLGPGNYVKVIKDALSKRLYNDDCQFNWTLTQMLGADADGWAKVVIWETQMKGGE